MFASTHHNPDENTAKYLQGQQSTAAAGKADDQAPTEVQQSATSAADAAVHAEVPSGPSIELAEKQTNGEAGQAANGQAQPVADKLSGGSPVLCALNDLFNCANSHVAMSVALCVNVLSRTHS